MKVQVLRRALFVTVLMLSVSNGVQAAADFNYFEEYGYYDELMSCVETLRPVLQPQNTDTISYVVDEIELRGAWFRFEISATITDIDGETQLDGYNVGCMANRWNDATKLVQRGNEQLMPIQLEALALNR